MNGQMASCTARLIALLGLIGLVESGHAAPSRTPPAPDIAKTVFFTNRLTHDPKESVWAAADRKAFTDLLGGQRCEWFVAPTQVQKEGFDRAERSMMSALIGQALADTGIIRSAALL